MRRARWIPVLCLAATLLGPTTAWPKPYWSGPRVVAGDVFQAAAGLSDGGVGTAVIEQLNGPTRMSVIRIDSHGRPGPARRLKGMGDELRPQVPLTLAANAAGDAVVTWAYDDASVPPEEGCRCESLCCLRAVAAYLPRSGPPLPVQTVSPARQDASPPIAAIGSRGVAVVAWQRSVEAQAAVAGRRGRFGAARTMAPGFHQDNDSPSAAAVLPRGRPFVLWRNSKLRGDERLLARTARRGPADFGGARTVGRERHGPGRVGFSGVLASWRGDVLTWDLQTLTARWALPGRSLGPPRSLPFSLNIGVPAAVNARGQAWMVGFGDTGSGRTIRAVRLDNGRPGRVRTVGPVGRLGSGGSAIGMDARGRAVVVWTRRDTEDHQDVWAARSDSAGRFGRPVRLSPRHAGGTYFLEPQVAVNARGDALAMWHDGLALYGDLYVARFFAH